LKKYRIARKNAATNSFRNNGLMRSIVGARPSRRRAIRPPP
jgi:hypothetical protein